MKRLASLLILLLLIIPVVVAENVYVPIPELTQTPYATMDIVIRCQHNIFSNQVLMYDGNGNETTLWIQPDGMYTGQFVPGSYTLILLDGNAGHIEMKNVTLTAAHETVVTFIGHAITFESGAKPTPTVSPTISPIPTVSPTLTPSPTTSPTTVPTTVPTVTPTPTPTPPGPICHWGTKIVCVPTLQVQHRCINPGGQCNPHWGAWTDGPLVCPNPNWKMETRIVVVNLCKPIPWWICN